MSRFWPFRPQQSRAIAETSVAVETDCAAPCRTPCAGSCRLTALPAGVRAIIVDLGCPFADATRLRALGVFEGACVGIVERGGGLQLDVHGSRLALDASVAAAILVAPLAS